MRNTVIATIVVALLAGSAASANGQPVQIPHVTILDVGMVDGHLLRVDIATSGLDPQGAESPDVTLEAWLGDARARGSLLLTHLPPRFSMDIDFPAGAVRVGAVKVGEFAPVRPFTENVRFPVQLTVRQGSRVATARSNVTLLLPTVIVPGVGNELSHGDKELLAAFVQHGYRGQERAPTVFRFGYPSHQVGLEEGALRLAEFVRQVVLAQAYAGKINIVGYSLGGLLARWNVQFDVDAWGTLVNRLILVGVPNEGSVLAYTYRNVPTFLPFAYFAHAPATRALVPTFPFWRAAPTEPWSMPPDSGNPALANLNTRPIPKGVRVWVFYGSRSGDDSSTLAGITEGGQSRDLAPGDGVVLADSAQGLPIHGGNGVAALLTSDVARVNLGPVGHSDLMAVGADRVIAALLDRVLETSIPPAPQQVPDMRENGNNR
jgi:lipase (class 2)